MTGTIDPRTYLDGSGRRHTWVAKRMGVSASYLSHLLAGRRPWTAGARLRFAHAIGMDAGAFNFASNATARVGHLYGERKLTAEGLDSRPERFERGDKSLSPCEPTNGSTATISAEGN